jgi:hypothetical protein
MPRANASSAALFRASIAAYAAFSGSFRGACMELVGDDARLLFLGRGSR